MQKEPHHKQGVSDIKIGAKEVKKKEQKVHSVFFEQAKTSML